MKIALPGYSTKPWKAKAPCTTSVSATVAAGVS
jgi:hypothetical protein